MTEQFSIPSDEELRAMSRKELKHLIVEIVEQLPAKDLKTLWSYILDVKARAAATESACDS